MIEVSDGERVDRALATLSGTRLFTGNAFGVTGLPYHASVRQVRRTRDESRTEFYEPPSGYPHAPVLPSTDADRVRDAIEHLQDPVIRLVHELLWSDDDPESLRSQAVGNLAAAIEATWSTNDPLETTVWTHWTNGLDGWAEQLGPTHSRQDARQRAERIDDPRLTPELLTRLRERLPAHVARCVADSAARQAHTRPSDARVIVEHLRHATVIPASGFTDTMVDQALRAAVAPEIDLVKDACEQVLHDRSSNRVRVAKDLIATTQQPLAVIDTILHRDDVGIGCHDDVARRVNNIMCEELRVTSRPPSDLGPMRTARTLARSPQIKQLVEENHQLLNSLSSGHLPSPAWSSGDTADKDMARMVTLIIALIAVAITVAVLAT